MSDTAKTRLGDKITTGLNDRPRDETIGQTGAGLPDDSSQPIDVDEAEIARVRTKLMGEDPDAGKPAADRDAGPGGSGAAGGDNPDEVSTDTPLAAENLCRHCGGTGRADGGECSECGGAGVVLTPVGGAG